MEPHSSRNLEISGNTVARLRKHKGWSREDLATESGYSKDTVDRIEESHTVGVLPRTAKDLAEALGVEVTAILSSPTPSLGDNNANALNPAPSELAVRLDVRVWSSCDSQRRGVSIRQPGTLPVRTGDRVRIEVEVSPLAYVYLVWITSRGEAQPLYPWEGFDWDRRRDNRKVSSLTLPLPDADQPLGGWPIDTPSGIETLVLMVSEMPFRDDSASTVRGRWGNFPISNKVVDPGRDYWFEFRNPGATRRRLRTRLGPRPVPIDDPIYEIHSLLRNRLTDHFNLVQAVCFANVGIGG